MTKIKIMLLMVLFFKLFTIWIDAFMINKKHCSEFLLYFESAIIFLRGRSDVSSTWICNGICLYVFNHDETYVSISSININSNYFRINWRILCRHGSYDVRGHSKISTYRYY